MTKHSKRHNTNSEILYNKILSLSRNSLLYTKMGLIDTFQNRIYLIFIHSSFVFLKIDKVIQKPTYKSFYQETFDHIFTKIELNMREIGFGDTTINKNMRFLIKTFYKILFNCKKYRKMNVITKKAFLEKYFDLNKQIKPSDISDLIEYFDNYQAFCVDLSLDSILKGELNFNYRL